jgi:hypothetical protein
MVEHVGRSRDCGMKMLFRHRQGALADRCAAGRCWRREGSAPASGASVSALTDRIGRCAKMVSTRASKSTREGACAPQFFCVGGASEVVGRHVLDRSRNQASPMNARALAVMAVAAG